ncbi:TetR/AcrR family transcriptional regulator [uncultured Tateyamaria sp.]|uniref:TetR/AcrR family transcriptional regulator n=1 Tax=uncultured Tateyamaria sp. TaxID=455651 RepID=UPI00260B659D|nr:TetR/AcrR family transcriptional regulator [uncultured Tateyamaria sp.]
MSSEPIDTPTKILQATLKLLEAPDAKLPTMSDIARATGISRQAVYLHFPSRTDLLVAATRYQDRLNDIDTGLAPSRGARSGAERLDAFVTAWGNYIPKIYGVARAIMAVTDTDAEAAAAWNTRMQDMREGCSAAISALAEDGTLPPGTDIEQATDLLWTILSVRNWENLTQTCGWSQDCYIATIRGMAMATLARDLGALTDVLACTDPPA